VGQESPEALNAETGQGRHDEGTHEKAGPGQEGQVDDARLRG
jgi:hypothetical protein